MPRTESGEQFNFSIMQMSNALLTSYTLQVQAVSTEPRLDCVDTELP